MFGCMVKAGIEFQSSLPSQGATCCNLIKHITHTDFNPRSPHRERLIVFTFDVFVTIFQSTLPSQGATEIDRYPASAGTISIHAPLTGSDPEQLRSRHIHKIFQSTLPSQGATVHNLGYEFMFVFQSTLPSQGATSYRVRRKNNTRISIHAPLTGSDYICGQHGYTWIISIHAPLTGSDAGSDASVVQWEISIHAPHTGSDRRHTATSTSYRHFNPRSPHRERLM